MPPRFYPKQMMLNHTTNVSFTQIIVYYLPHFYKSIRFK